jgi:hypothetical protein
VSTPALSSRERLARRGRRALAALSSLAAAYVIWEYGGGGRLLCRAEAASLALAAVLFLRAGVASQLLARAILLANLLDGLHEQMAGGLPHWPLAAGLGLLAADDIGLGERSRDAFKPAAHRGLVVMAIIVAIATALHLTLFGWIYRHWQGPDVQARYLAGTVMVGGAAWLGVASLGLYRLRVWGLLALALGGAVLAGLMFSNTLRLMPFSWTLAYELGLLGLTLVALSAPILWAMTGRVPSPKLSAWLGQGLPRWCLVAMIMWSAALAMGSDAAICLYKAMNPQNFVTFSGR